LVTSATSYFAFFLLIFVALLLMGIFVVSSLLQLNTGTRRLVITKSVPLATSRPSDHRLDHNNLHQQQQQQQQDETSSDQIARSSAELSKEAPRERNELEVEAGEPAEQEWRPTRRVSARDKPQVSKSSLAGKCFVSMIYLLACIILVVIIIIWLVNSGELVRESISSQLDMAYARYQFSNRSNYYSIVIDGMQDINNCCGSLDYTDFPHQRTTGLSSGLYPGSCCGKNIFGVNARVLCTPEDIWRARQTAGCTTVLANYYDLMSTLVVPVALICLLINITIIVLTTLVGDQNNLSDAQGSRLAPMGLGSVFRRRPVDQIRLDSKETQILSLAKSPQASKRLSVPDERPERREN